MGAKSLLEDKTLYVALFLTLLLVFVVNRFRPKSWLPDNTVMVFAGIMLGFFMRNPTSSELSKDMFSSFFFNFFVPPIIFAAALNQTQNSYMGVAFALFSIVFTTFFVGQWMELNFDETGSCLMKGCLLWGIILAPVNARYAIASHEIHELEDVELFIPRNLNSWLQSETQLAGPIALVFFSSLMRSEGLNSDPLVSMEMFARTLALSVVLGSLFGLFAALSLKTPFGDKEKSGPASAYREGSLILLWAVASHFTAKYFGLSPVGALFCTGLVLNSLAFDIISDHAKYAARVGSASLGAVCEGFILLYIAVYSTSSPVFVWGNVQTHMRILLGCLLARLVVAVVMTVFLGVCRGTSLVTFLVGNLSGIKSVIPFVLALRLGQTDIISGTIFVILFTQCITAPLFALYLEYLKPVEPEPVPVVITVESTDNARLLPRVGGGGSSSQLARSGSSNLKKAPQEEYLTFA